MWWEAVGGAFTLIVMAEIGDKSQLVCMALAARHKRPLPVFVGAVAAFAILNALAAAFGAALSAWLPQAWVLGAMALLFFAFGVHALRQGGEDDDEESPQISGHGLAATAFLMIFLAELGDKTQVSVGALAGLYPALPVWVGGTLALAFTSGLGVIAGKALLKRISLDLLHRISGGLFLVLSGLAVWRLSALQGWL
ncbi:MAG: TMEM165/GDT1 family protein [Alphaproteobacteria bacterium]|nr:TMEM165/GDT1 family protein [Alphaproteobacteria bacterium]